MTNQSGPNTTESLQIWLNLPAKNKRAEPGYKMLWREEVPRPVFASEGGAQTAVLTVAGQLPGHPSPPSPPPASWAADPANDVAVWIITMDPGASWVLPAATHSSVDRALYFFTGDELEVAGTAVRGKHNVFVDAAQETTLRNTGSVAAKILMLQGRPIEEPVARYGPFVLNTEAELHQVFRDYHAGKFGVWPFDIDDPVNKLTDGRFSRTKDGQVSFPPKGQ